LNGTHQLLVCDDYVNVLGDNINVTEENKGTLADGSKEVSLEVNKEKTKYVLMSHYQNAEKSLYSIKIANRSFENTAKLKYFGKALTNRN
jgi:hypothetical protein